MVNDDVLSLRGNRDLWMDFTDRTRRQKKTVWETLEPMIREYLKKKKVRGG